MPWKSRPTPHEHDLPGPRRLGNDGALKGWVWTCGGPDALDFELVEYRRGDNAFATWKDVANGQTFTLTRDN